MEVYQARVAEGVVCLWFGLDTFALLNKTFKNDPIIFAKKSYLLSRFSYPCEWNYHLYIWPSQTWE